MTTVKIADITTYQLLHDKGLFEIIISLGFEYIRFDKDTSTKYNLPDIIFRVSQRGIHTGETINLEDKSLEFVKFTLIKDEIIQESQDGIIKKDRIVDLWWDNLSIELKNLFSVVIDVASDEYYWAFWNKLDRTDKKNLYQYWQYKKGILKPSENNIHSLEMEVIAEVSEVVLEIEFNKPSADMFNEDGSFYETYQDRFNEIYDELEENLKKFDFKTI